MEDASPEQRHRPDAGVEKLAAREPDAREPDAPSLPLERLVRLASQVPGTRDEVRCEEQSCAETALADAGAQLELLVSLLLEPLAAQLAKLSRKSELQLGAPGESQPAEWPDAQEPASLVVPQRKQVAERLAAVEPKMSAWR
jgi:hypothetical protein